MKTRSDIDEITTDESGLGLAALVAGEDLRVGDDIAVLTEIVEIPSCFWESDAATLSPHELVRLRYTCRDPGVPLQVVAICLPFVCTLTPKDQHRLLDLRMIQIARLTPAYARSVRKGPKERPKVKNKS